MVSENNSPMNATSVARRSRPSSSSTAAASKGSAAMAASVRRIRISVIPLGSATRWPSSAGPSAEPSTYANASESGTENAASAQRGERGGEQRLEAQSPHQPRLQRQQARLPALQPGDAANHQGNLARLQEAQQRLGQMGQLRLCALRAHVLEARLQVGQLVRLQVVVQHLPEGVQRAIQLGAGVLGRRSPDAEVQQHRNQEEGVDDRDGGGIEVVVRARQELTHLVDEQADPHAADARTELVDSRFASINGSSAATNSSNPPHSTCAMCSVPLPTCG